jgi:hypothetical protein
MVFIFTGKVTRFCAIRIRVHKVGSEWYVKVTNMWYSRLSRQESFENFLNILRILFGNTWTISIFTYIYKLSYMRLQTQNLGNFKGTGSPI